jgi:alpha-mannosidase
MSPHYHVTLVSHTHWDRAWYATFQEYRIRLVRLVDRLLNLLRADPDYRVYMLDGQISVLEDYLEVRPQRAAELQAHCRSGRVQVGPWYVLADEFLVSPEALVRNLILGHRMAGPYGGVMKIGYVPDGFGHIAQLPQIFRGFGIDSAFFWRGMGAEGDRLGTEFEWAALDGSHVTTILMPFGYHNVSNLGYAIHWGDTSQMEFDWDLAQEQIARALAQLKPFAHTPALLLMNGIDHAEAEPRIPQAIARANQALPDATIHHGTLAEHLARVRDAGAALPTFSGEFRWGRYSEVLQGVYSTRIYLKQANHRVETLLERYVEPLNALAWWGGADVPDGTDDLIWTAWRYLLQSQPHDDIYGAGIDPVHRETMFRFDQAEQIGQALARNAVRYLARQADCTRQPGTPIFVYNPLNQERHEVAVGDVDFDFDDAVAGDFQIVDGAGHVVPHQVLDDRTLLWMEVFKPNRKRRVRVAFPVVAPACGYRIYYAQAAAAPPASAASDAWQVSDRGAANRYLSFTIAADGGLDVVDRATGHRYAGLHHFVDVEDAGDEYSYAPCRHSQSVTTRGQPARVTLVRHGPCLATFRVERTLALPVGLTEDRQHRRAETVEIPIVSEITLHREQPGLHIVTEVDNRACDHKLSALFPTNLQPDQAHVDESFAIIARDLALPPSPGWVEDPTPLMHQRAFTDLSQDGCGLAILNRGLASVEVTPARAGTEIALTLLRCVGWLSRADLSTRRVAAGPLVEAAEAQCLGRHRFEYAILPHAGDWRAVYPLAHAYVAPLLVARADTHEGLELREMNITRDDPVRVKGIPWPRGGPNPDQVSFLQVEPRELVVSALRRSQDGQGIVVRFYNVEAEAVTARVTAWQPLAAAWRTNLNEERQESLAVRDGCVVEMPVRGGEVVTVELVTP